MGGAYADDTGVAPRRETLRMCVRLLDHWPQRFVDFRRQRNLGIVDSQGFRDRSALAFEEVHRNLYRPLLERLVDY